MNRVDMENEPGAIVYRLVKNGRPYVGSFNTQGYYPTLALARRARALFMRCPGDYRGVEIQATHTEWFPSGLL